jgi:hypothetical protein
MPVMAPPLKATSSAAEMPLRAASAVRTLARTETFMPMKPVAPDSTAPIRKPMAISLAERQPDHHEEYGTDDADGRVLLWRYAEAPS